MNFNSKQACNGVRMIWRMAIMLVHLLLCVLFFGYFTHISDHSIPEENFCSHRQDVHQNVALKSVVKSAWIITFREAEQIDKNSNQRKNIGDQNSRQSATRPFCCFGILVSGKSSVDTCDQRKDGQDDKDTCADNTESRKNEPGDGNVGDSTDKHEAKSDEVTLAHLRTLVHAVVDERNLHANDDKSDKEEVEGRHGGVDVLVDGTEHMEQGGGRHGAQRRQQEEQRKNSVHAACRGNNTLVSVDDEEQHHEEAKTMGPDVHGLVVPLKNALKARSEVITDAVTSGQIWLLHTAKFTLFYSANVPRWSLFHNARKKQLSVSQSVKTVKQTKNN